MSASNTNDLYPGIPTSQALAFRAVRNGTRLGTHTVRFVRSDRALNVEIAIDYTVKIGLFTVFRYTLRAQECWQNGELISFDCTTNNNGKQEFARAAREDAALMVEGTRARRYSAPEGAILCSHWNKTQLAVPTINPQDGSLLNFVVSSRGKAVVANSAGRKHDCERFHMLGPNPIDLWYDDSGVWLALQAKAQDGSSITYTRQG